MRDDSADEAWLQAYAADDRGALGALFDRYAPRFIGLYQHCLQDRAASEELLQVTFAEVHRLRRTYRADSVARAWLFGIAVRVCLAALRSRERRSNPSPRVAVGRNAARIADPVHAALTALDGAERVVLYLHRYERMSFGEIAEVLGSSAQAVRMQAIQTYSSLHERLRPLIDRGETP